MPIRHVDPAVLIGGFIVVVLLIAFGAAHLVDRFDRFRIDMPD